VFLGPFVISITTRDTKTFEEAWVLRKSSFVL
jgi:hypothetical protein